MAVICMYVCIGYSRGYLTHSRFFIYEYLRVESYLSDIFHSKALNLGVKTPKYILSYHNTYKLEYIPFLL